MEIYANRPTQRYSESDPEDEAGLLTTDPFDVTEWLPYRVEAAAFEKVLRNGA